MLDLLDLYHVYILYIIYNIHVKFNVTLISFTSIMFLLLGDKTASSLTSMYVSKMHPNCRPWAFIRR